MSSIISTIERADRAVSPVIGVVLLVGITVLLAATIAALVLGMGSTPSVAPHVDWQFEPQNDTMLLIAHGGGDAVDGGNVRIVGEAVHDDLTLDDIGDGVWRTGTSANVTVDPTVADPTVRLVWDTGGNNQLILAEYAIPST
ncbi:MAG: type IV pilin N-terminal domain-containing protein [Halobacteriota archaeon]